MWESELEADLARNIVCWRASIPYLEQFLGLASAVSPFFGRLAVHCVWVTGTPFHASSLSRAAWGTRTLPNAANGIHRLTLTSKCAEASAYFLCIFPFCVMEIHKSACHYPPSNFFCILHHWNSWKFLLYGWPSCLLFKVDPELFLLRYFLSFSCQSERE